MENKINLNGKDIDLNKISTEELKQIFNNIYKDELKLKQELNDILESLT